MKNKNIQRLIIAATLIGLGGVAVAQVTAPTQQALTPAEPTGHQHTKSGQGKKKLNLSLDQLPSAEKRMGGSGGPVVSEQGQRLAEQLQPRGEERAGLVTRSENENDVSIGGGVMTEKVAPNAQNALQSGKDYVEAIDGARVDLEMKF